MIELDTDQDLLASLDGPAGVVVYGNGAQARAVIHRIMELRSGVKVRVGVTDVRRTRRMIDVLDLDKGALVPGTDPARHFIVESIGALAHDCPEATVIVARGERYRAEMAHDARQAGFRTVATLALTYADALEARWEASVTREASVRTLRETRYQTALAHRSLNEQRLDHLRRRVRDGQRVRVAFLVTSPAKFAAESVCLSMRGHEVFDPVVFAFDEESWEGRPASESRNTTAELLAYCDRLRASGIPVEWGYDAVGRPRPIECCRPDVIFHSAPYLVGRHPHQTVRRMVENHLTCYVPYGAEVANEAGYHFDTESIAWSWIHFVSGPAALGVASRTADGHALNTVDLGLPGLDALDGDSSDPAEADAVRLDEGLPGKLRTGNPTVVYAPHWAMTGWHALGSFHHAAPRILEYARANPDVNVVLRPHPRIGPELTAPQGPDAPPISHRQYLDLVEAWDGLPNGAVVAGGNPVALFRDAEVLITDSYSFVATWLPTEKPCIYLVADDRREALDATVYPFIAPILDAYYLRGTADEALGVLDGLISGHDPKCADRRAVAHHVMPGRGHAGRAFTDYLDSLIRPHRAP